jgi:4'-phosphopantetheinyl transferase
MADATSPELIQWILDMRSAWPEASETQQLETHADAARALSLLTSEERSKVLRYYHVQDAKMAIASHLLKHYAISKYCGVPWWETTLVRDVHTKPVYRDPATGLCPIDFNVSHQAGVVALAAVHGYEDGSGRHADVGVDVVCTSERRQRDHKMVFEEVGGGGWLRFVDMHSDVFADSEARYLKYHLPSTVPGSATATREQVLDYKLRIFYTLWCLREAYVKMTGEALLAEWLKVLEFRTLSPPEPTAAFDVPASMNEQDRQLLTQHDVFFRKQRVTDANITLQSLGPDYMVCTAVRTSPVEADALSWRMNSFQILDLEHVLSFAESML